jgi:hypothetical protein
MFKSKKTILSENQKLKEEIVQLKGEAETLKSIIKKEHQSGAARYAELQQQYDRLADAAAKKATPPEGCTPGAYCEACIFSVSKRFPSARPLEFMRINICTKNACKNFALKDTPKEAES